MPSAILRTLGRAGRADILTHLLAHPRQRFGVNQLARKTSVPAATASRAVRDLDALGLAWTERIANVKMVELNRSSPAVKALAGLDVPDPHTMAWRAFSKALLRRLPALPPDHMRLFGSVRKKKARPGSDVDVMVAYGGSGYPQAKVVTACVKASGEVLDRYGIMVVPMVIRDLVDLP